LIALLMMFQSIFEDLLTFDRKSSHVIYQYCIDVKSLN
jgi:hypothetical protein